MNLITQFATALLMIAGHLFAVVAILSGQILVAQTRVEFEVADVHKTAPRADGRPRLAMEGGTTVRGGRYEIYNATMLDLIKTAYGVHQNAVIGGPGWLGFDRFDVIAKPPEGSSSSPSIRSMLQALLQERFKLSVREQIAPMPAWVLLKDTSGPKLKSPSTSEDKGCRLVTNQRLACRNITLDEFAAILSQSPRTTLPVINATDIENTWDFDLNYNVAGGAIGVSENNPILPAITQQVGLRIELRQAPARVLVVESVNPIPTPNSVNVEQRLPPDMTHFEVASIRPCESVDFGVNPSGALVTTGCQRLSFLFVLAFEQCSQVRNGPNSVIAACPDLLVLPGGPAWMTEKLFSIQARAPIPLGPITEDSKFRAMLRNLLIERFKVATHYEPREVPVKVLTADKPKLVRGDSSVRSRCEQSGGLPGVPTVLDCRNITITQFAQALESSGLSVGRVVDETKLEGTWDLKLTYGGSLPGVRGGISFSEGIEQQLGLKLGDARRLMPVVIIDHIDERPTEN